MRKHAVTIQAPPGALDTCGTGGDKSETFNVSTATALVAAGMGIPVAKHGGRSVSSNTGSADVLKVLGVKIELPPSLIVRCVNEIGIGFMFARGASSGHAARAPIRRELGVRTVFNLLGPLANPACAELQLLGVFQPDLCETFAEVLRRLGSRGALIVCGAGRAGVGHLDEISTFGPTHYARLHEGRITAGEIDPLEWGIPPAAADALTRPSRNQRRPDPFGAARRAGPSARHCDVERRRRGVGRRQSSELAGRLEVGAGKHR